MPFDQAQYRKQKATLTRAINSKDKAKILAACTLAVKQWGDDAWPDDWARWQRALDGCFPVFTAPRLEDL